MKIFERIVTVLGFITLAILLWKFDAAVVWAQVSKVGWGFLIILPMQLCDHVLNAVGWRYAFSASDASRIPFRQLVRIRVAGDGVNYLTPSGTIAGEIIRPGMLADHIPAEARNSSVVVAKFAQALGQAFFALAGMLVLLPLRLGFLPGRQIINGLAGALLLMLVAAASLSALLVRRRDGSYWLRLSGTVASLREQMGRYLRCYPGRFALSAFFFMLGFAWGAWEVLVICFFLGVPMDPITALSVEVLSVVLDSLLFMVPAKVGTQEAGKTAIFAGLGLPAGQGLAFGLVRHIRELVWAGTGFLIYAWDRRRRAARASAVLPPLPAEPAARAD